MRQSHDPLTCCWKCQAGSRAGHMCRCHSICQLHTWCGQSYVSPGSRNQAHTQCTRTGWGTGCRCQCHIQGVPQSHSGCSILHTWNHKVSVCILIRYYIHCFIFILWYIVEFKLYVVKYSDCNWKVPMSNVWLSCCRQIRNNGFNCLHCCIRQVYTERCNFPSHIFIFRFTVAITHTPFGCVYVPHCFKLHHYIFELLHFIAHISNVAI